MAGEFVRCDGDFLEIGEDLNMENFGSIKIGQLATPNGYVPPDISRELAMLERYAQKGEKMANGETAQRPSLLAARVIILIHMLVSVPLLRNGSLGPLGPQSGH